MLYKKEAFTNGALGQLANLHAMCLQDSLTTSLGRAVLKSYYQYVLDSKQDILFTVFEGEQVIGACVLSLAPDTLTKRFVKKNFLLVGLNMAKGFALSAFTRKKIINFLFNKGSKPSNIVDMPEVVQIYTDASFRNKRIGTRLIEMTEEFLKEQGIACYYLKTLSDPENLALHFYHKRNFTKIDDCTFCGRAYTYLVKDLSR